MKIILVCNQGVSTGIVARKMQEAAKEQGIDLEIKAISDSEVETQATDCDVILVGPQIRYLEGKIREKMTAPVKVIDMRDYGMMNGKKIFNDTLQFLKESEKSA